MKVLHARPQGAGRPPTHSLVVTQPDERNLSHDSICNLETGDPGIDLVRHHARRGGGTHLLHLDIPTPSDVVVGDVGGGARTRDAPEPPHGFRQSLHQFRPVEAEEGTVTTILHTKTPPTERRRRAKRAGGHPVSRKHCVFQVPSRPGLPTMERLPPLFAHPLSAGCVG